MAHATASERPAATPDPFNLGFLLLAGVLIGAGLMLVFAWLVTRSWLYFGSGVVLAPLGGYLLFQKGTGADSA